MLCCACLEAMNTSCSCEAASGKQHMAGGEAAILGEIPSPFVMSPGADYWHHSCTKQIKSKINFTHVWDFTARPETQSANNLNLIWIYILHTLRWTVARSHAHVYTNVTDSEVLGSLASVKQTTPLFFCYNLNNNLTVCVHTKHACTHAHTLASF